MSKQGARNSPYSGPPPKATRREKVRDLLPLLNFTESLQATFKLPGPYTPVKASWSSSSAKLPTLQS